MQIDEMPQRATSPLLLPPLSDRSWLLIEDGFNLAREHEIESLFTVANGYVGTRGSLAEGSSLSAPATFIAGIFDVDPRGSVPELAVAPDWMQLRAAIDGNNLRVEGSRTLVHHRILDMREGILHREWRFEDTTGRITHVQGLRFASLADRHLLVQSVLLTPENYSGRIHFELVIVPPSARPGQIVLTPEVDLVPSTGRFHSLRVLELHTGTGSRVALAAGNRLRVAQNGWQSPAMNRAGDRSEPWEIELQMGKTYRLDRAVAIYTSRDTERPADAAVRHLEHLLPEGVEQLIEEHVNAWALRWRSADVIVEGDEQAQHTLRFAAYHLISAANAEDEYVSIAARALTGPAYKGHVFWDTDIFMLPFFVLTDPSSARALLMYRYHTLAAAKDKARRLGYRGALYAWESADSGEETTPPYALAPDGEVIRILSGQQEQHISADVAYAVWQYWQATGDDAFMQQAGAEIILETARFWASRGEFEGDGRYHIRCVIGPDEYHEGVDDNAFTNGMAQWNLERAAEIVRLGAHRWPRQWSDLATRIGLKEAEPQEWENIAQHMYTGLDPDTGLIEEFRGYFQLEDMDISHYPPDRPPIDVLFGRDRVRGSQLIKQADVVMLIYLLWDRYTPEQREANFHYYEPRTAHGSSLSPAIHALVAARLGKMDLAQRFFRQAAEIDLANNMGNAAGGIHAAALGGLWQSAIFGFGGLHVYSDRLVFAPHCPPGWRSLAFPLNWRGQRLHVDLTADSAEIVSEATIPVKVCMGFGTPATISPAGRMAWTRTSSGSWSEVQRERAKQQR